MLGSEGKREVARSSSAEAPGRRSAGPSAAALDLLLETTSIFTHDASNPLQSVCVMLELAVEDAGDPAQRARWQRTLAAAEQLRDLLRDFGALARVQRSAKQDPPPLGVIVDRCRALLRRRCERLGVILRVDLGEAAKAPLPCGEAAWAVLGLMLAALATVRTLEHGGGELCIRAGRSRSGNGQDVTLSFSVAAAVELRDTIHTQALDPARVRRVRAILDGTPLHLVLQEDGSVDLRLPAPP